MLELILLSIFRARRTSPNIDGTRIVDMVYQLYQRGRPPYKKNYASDARVMHQRTRRSPSPSQRCEQSLHVPHIIRRHWRQANYPPRDKAHVKKEKNPED